MTLEEVKPIRGYLVVDPDTAERKTESGIYIADTTKLERPQTGKVLKVGDDLKTEYGAVIDSPVKVGDKIIFKKWGGNEVKIDKKDYFFVRFDDVIGIC
jgi:chaperonin GroES